ncbi:hypothetical protein Tco_0084957 [Tanacetum coccineum]
MTTFHEISRRARDKYHNLEDDVMVKNIFNSGKHKDGVGMTIPNVPTTHAPRKSIVIRLHISPRRSERLTPPAPIPTTAEADDIILQDTIQLSLTEQKSRDELEAKQNVQKIKEHLIAEEIEKLVEGSDNVENVEVNSSTLRKNDNLFDPDTRLEPRSDKESPEVEIIVVAQPVNVNEEEEESAEDDYELKRREKGKEELTETNLKPSSSTLSSSSPKSNITATNRLLSLFKPNPGRFKRYMSFFDELQCRYGYLFEHLKTMFMPRKKFNVLAQHLQEVMEESLPKMVDKRVKELTKKQVPLYVAEGLIMEREKSQEDVAKMIADAIQQVRENLRSEISSQINDVITNHIPSQVDSSVRNYMSGHILHVHPTQAIPASVQEQQQQLYLTMRDNPLLQQDDLPIWLALKYKFERLYVATTPCRSFVVRPRDQDDPQDDAHPEGENDAKRQKTSEHGTYMFGESSSGENNESEPDDDELPTEKVSQELVDEMSQSVDEAKLRKVVDEMLRQ